MPTDQGRIWGTPGTKIQEDLGITRTTVTCSRPQNMGDYMTRAKPHQAPGQAVTESIEDLDKDWILANSHK